MTSVGFPHSDISGSTPACDSPELFAANHVLHRLLTPRHPSCALSSLTTNLLWTASSSRRTWARFAPRKLVDGYCHQNFATRRLQGRDRSSTKELGLDGFHRRSFLSKTRFRVVVCYSLFKEPRGRVRLSAKDLELYQFVTFRQKSRSVERKGIEPLTPGLQSRCSPS
jgi:hypothetical protein